MVSPFDTSKPAITVVERSRDFSTRKATNGPSMGSAPSRQRAQQDTPLGARRVSFTPRQRCARGRNGRRRLVAVGVHPVNGCQPLGVWQLLHRKTTVVHTLCLFCWLDRHGPRRLHRLQQRPRPKFAKFGAFDNNCHQIWKKFVASISQEFHRKIDGQGSNRGVWQCKGQSGHRLSSPLAGIWRQEPRRFHNPLLPCCSAKPAIMHAPRPAPGAKLLPGTRLKAGNA